MLNSGDACTLVGNAYAAPAAMAAPANTLNRRSLKRCDIYLSSCSPGGYRRVVLLYPKHFNLANKKILLTCYRQYNTSNNPVNKSLFAPRVYYSLGHLQGNSSNLPD